MRIPESSWVAELVRPKPAKIPWPLAARAAIAIATPIAVGMAIGWLVPGVLASIGGLAGSLQDKGGTYRFRAIRAGVVAGAGALGFLIGTLAYGDGILTAVFVLLAGLIAGFVSTLGTVGSIASLQFLINVIVASGIDFGTAQVWLPPALYLSGFAWALLVSLVGGIGRVSAPEREAVAGVYRTLATQMELTSHDGAELARRDLTAAMNTAYDSVVSSRATSGGRDRRMRRLAALLNAAIPLVETTVALHREEARIPLRLSAATRQIASAIQRGDIAGIRSRRADTRKASVRRGDLHVTRGRSDADVAAGAHGGDVAHADTPAPPTVAIELSALDTELAGVRSILSGADLGRDTVRHAPTLREHLESFRDAATAGATTWKPILRLVLCLAVAEAVGALLPSERPYWVALTVAVTLKPDFGSVFSRAVQRGLGTVVGVVLGSAVLVFLPFGVPTVLAIALFAALMPISLARNYGLFTTFLTPVIVLLLEIIKRGDESLVLDRLIDTAVGCAIVLIVGYLPWPSIWHSRSRLGDAVAEATGEVLAYLRAALEGHSDHRSTMRRRAYRALSDVRTVLQQALAEPPPVSKQASAWWPAIVALERLTDAATAVVTRSGLGRGRGSPDGVAQVVSYMAELDAAVRQQREPAELPLPNELALSGVVGELRTAQAVLTGSGDRG